MLKQDILGAAMKLTGWMIQPELEWLIEQTSTRRTVVEIGSWKGRSMKAMSLSIQGVAYSVDHWHDSSFPPPPNESRWDSDWLEVKYNGSGSVKGEFMRNLANEIASGKCVPLGLPSELGVRKMTEILGGRKVDMVFIDADHEYGMVKRDIEAWRPLLVDGGLLCGHDYPWPGVHKAVAELVPNHRYLHDTSIWYAVV